VLMLHHLGEHAAALHIDAALANVYTAKKHVTRDVGGTAGTNEFADAVIEALHTVPVPAPVVKEVEL
jgi:isocitrate dehydrogenase (NAD+)